MSVDLDGAGEVRAGEEPNIAALETWLKSHVPGTQGSLTVRQFQSGHSNLTYLLEMGGKEMVLRRPPFGTKVKTAHDMGREFTVLSRLHGVFPQAPLPLAHCDDESILGAPFYVMERVKGVILRRTIPVELGMGPEQVRQLCLNWVDTLAALHAVDWKAAGFGDLGRPEGYVERQVTGWTKRYRDAQTDTLPAVDALAVWLAANRPGESGAALIHNDYKFDNVVLDPAQPTTIIGVLDWEMATVGDPLMDLGTALGYWLEKSDPKGLRSLPFGPTDVPGALTRQEIVQRYGETTGKQLPDMVFHHAFALFKIAVVLQQIYARYKAGLTKDERFAGFIHGVRMLCERGLLSVEQGHI